jgi:hypothetical protein
MHWPWATRLVLVAALIAAVAVPSALALGLKKDKNHKPPQRARCLNRAPTLYFERGTLQRDGFRSWLLDGRPVAFTKQSCVVDELAPGSPASPHAGRIAVVTGHKVGGTLVVHQATLLDLWTEVEVDITALPGEEESVLERAGPDTPH